MGTPVRIGVAIGIPQPWGQEIDEARLRAGDPQAPMIPSHVTLLGPADVDAESLPAIKAHLAAVAAGQSGFVLRLRGTGTFRPLTEVVFVTVAGGAAECERLAELVRSGPLDRELRFPYHPHVTIAHDLEPEALDRAYERLSGFSATFPVDHFTLYVHGADGRWRPVRDFPLGARTGPDGR